MKEQRKARILAPSIRGIPLREFGFIVLAVALVLPLFIGMTHLFATGVTDRNRDLVDARTLEGSGTVTGLGFAAGGTSGSGYVELDGRPVTLELWDPGSALRLQVGQKVAFTYRVGRSGAWYIQQIARAPDEVPARTP